MFFTRCLVQNPFPLKLQTLFLSIKFLPEVCPFSSSTHFQVLHWLATLCQISRGSPELYVQVGDTCNKLLELDLSFNWSQCLQVPRYLGLGGHRHSEEFGSDFAEQGGGGWM